MEREDFDLKFGGFLDYFRCLKGFASCYSVGSFCSVVASLLNQIFKILRVVKQKIIFGTNFHQCCLVMFFWTSG